MANVPLMSSAAEPPPAPGPAERSFQATTEQILKHDIPWEAYLSAKLITPTDFQLLRRYDHKSPEMQSGLLEESGPAYIRMFLTVLRNVFKEETTEYVLAVIHQLLSVNRQRISFFFQGGMGAAQIFDPLLRLLTSRNWYILESSTKLLSQLIAQTASPPSPYPPLLGPGPSSSSSSSSGSSMLRAAPQGYSASALSDGVVPEVDPRAMDIKPVLDTFIPWLIDQLPSPAHPTRGVPNALSCLASVLRVPKARDVFVLNQGIPHLLPLITPTSSQSDVQVLYDSVLCVWLLSFNASAVEALKPSRAVKALNDVARSSSKEKIVRVAVMALNNLLLKGGNLGAKMVELGLPKTVQSLKLQSWRDEDLVEVLESLQQGLKHNLKVLSSFDKYRAEVLSGSLDWTPMHKDPAFWRDNVMRFEDREFQVLHALVGLLGSSNDKRTLAVACFDLSQFISNHPSGRHIALDLRVKERVMVLMQDDDPQVRKQALLCIQKLLLSAKYVSYLQN